MGVGFGNIFTSLITALILVIGHALNIVLGAMAILVHGVRLNVLEFSNHMDVQWTGFGYSPFKKTQKESDKNFRLALFCHKGKVICGIR